MDPCIFKFTKGSDVAIGLIHTDDCDMVGSNDEMMNEIFEVLNKKWGCKKVDPGFVLGVKRDRYIDKVNGDDVCEMTMTAYCDGIVEAFKEHLDDGRVETPFDPKVFISKAKSQNTEEEQNVYKDMGWQRLVGCLLWAARNCFPEMMVGVSFLCRLMSRPTKKAWDAGIHMVKWLRQNRDRGIIFRSSGNFEPIAFSDASDKSDPADGLAQAGFNIMMAGGPVIFSSKKLKHCAPNCASSHVEYMAMSHCNQSIVWLRQLFMELELDEFIKAPTTSYGDNKAANQLCKEEAISTGNQYIYMSYHWNKECEDNGFVKVDYVNTKCNLADCFTKPIELAVVQRLVGLLCGYGDFRKLLSEASQPSKV